MAQKEKIDNIINIKEISIPNETTKMSVSDRIEILKISSEISRQTEDYKNTNLIKNHIENTYLWLLKLVSQDSQKEKYSKDIDVKHTYSANHILCLEHECLAKELKFKTLIKHLKSTHGMSFADYRNKWNLPSDYPSVCENYSEVRKNIAKK